MKKKHEIDMDLKKIIIGVALFILLVVFLWNNPEYAWALYDTLKEIEYCDHDNPWCDCY